MPEKSIKAKICWNTCMLWYLLPRMPQKPATIPCENTRLTVNVFRLCGTSSMDGGFTLCFMFINLMALVALSPSFSLGISNHNLDYFLMNQSICIFSWAIRNPSKWLSMTAFQVKKPWTFLFLSSIKTWDRVTGIFLKSSKSATFLLFLICARLMAWWVLILEKVTIEFP